MATAYKPSLHQICPILALDLCSPQWLCEKYLEYPDYVFVAFRIFRLVREDLDLKPVQPSS